MATDGGGQTIAFESIDGPPPGVFDRMVSVLDSESKLRSLSIVSREGSAAYRVRSYLSAQVVRGRTQIAWVWDVYDRDQQRALRQAAANAVHRDITLDRDLDREATGNVCRRANAIMATASSSQLRALRRAVQPVYDDLRRDPRTRTFIDAIERLKRDLGPLPPDALPACPPTSRPVAGAESPIDGVYHMTSSIKRDSKRDPTPGPENYGTWTFVLSHGRFAFDQEDHETGQEACTWGYGTFRVKGDQVQWLFENGGGIAPTGALNKPGEFFVFRWSRYRDTLALSPVRGEISPWNFRVRPWRLVSRTPTRRYFDRRCPPPAGAV
jgi:hypothetical protein